jgi:triosephosphate isomerase
MRKNIVAGNWKMNNNFQEAEDLIEDLLDLMKDNELDNPEMVLCPPFPYLELATDMTDESLISVSAQNVSNYTFGAYTGEISALMLKSIGVRYSIVGHSERRKYFNETAELLKEKVDALLENGLQVIFCCGEQLEERESKIHFDIVKKQIKDSLFHLTKPEFENIIIAYEPVWAIGTGVTASADQAQEMHAFIRSLLKNKFSEAISENTTLLYGGSCNAKNARELFANPDVDGGLIGGASLKADDFYKIYKSF